MNLSWTIPFSQVMPDSFSLNYNINKLSGSPASQTTDSLTLINGVDANLMANGGSFSYLLEGLTAYTEYSFSLSSNYSSSISDPVAVTATTDQDSKKIHTCTAIYRG